MPAMTAAYAAVLKNETSDAATIINIAQRLGGALGAITTVIVLEQAATTDNQLAYGWGGRSLSRLRSCINGHIDAVETAIETIRLVVRNS